MVNALQPWLAGGQDVFINVLDPTGTQLIQSTYIGSTGNEVGYRIALDSAGNPYVTGTRNGFSYPVTVGVNQGGIFRTDDGGSSWSPSSKGLPHVSIGALAFDPAFPTRVVAGTGHGMAPSDDGGVTWQTTFGASPNSKGLAPTIAVDVVNALGGLFRGADLAAGSRPGHFGGLQLSAFAPVPESLSLAVVARLALDLPCGRLGIDADGDLALMQTVVVEGGVTRQNLALQFGFWQQNLERVKQVLLQHFGKVPGVVLH